jgi:hypothetical protein
MSQPDLTRREMYDLVWSMPTERVAENFGLSEASLRKIYDRYRVPVPPRSYWAQKANGKDVKRTRLYRTDTPQDEWIYLSLSQVPHPAMPPRAAAPEPGRRPTRPKSSKKTVVRPVEPLNDVHPTIIATARTLRGATPDAHGAVRHWKR